MWLKGSTTWVNLVDDIVKLAAGEIADGAANTVPLADRWIRETALENFLSSPTTENYALPNMSNRAGYWCIRTSAAPTASDVCRQSAIHTSSPATRWCTVIRVTTANSVAGNYSTAVMDVRWYNADTGASISSSAPSPTAGGVVTINNGGTVTVSAASGILTVGMVWTRWFTSTYVGGIDWFGGIYAHRVPATVAFSVNPPGTAGVDYDVREEITAGTQFSMVQATAPTGGQLCGVGWKTTAGMTGALYTFTYTVARQTCRFVAGSGGTAGQINTIHNCAWISDAGTFRNLHGNSTSAWLRPFNTPGSVTNGAMVQYWMSVTADAIVIVLNADPAQTGVLTCAWMGVFTPIVTDYDIFPIFFGYAAKNHIVDSAANYADLFDAQTWLEVYDQKARQDLSESRDWQTLWMREDFSTQSWENASKQLMGVGVTHGMINQADSLNQRRIQPFMPPSQEKPLRFDGRWWLYNCYWSDVAMLSSKNSGVGSGETSAANIADRVVRGVPGMVWFLPELQWNSGDELTDTDTGDIYFLVKADYHGIGGRWRLAANAYAGGAAIKEL